MPRPTRAQQHLCDRDPVLATVIERIGPLRPLKPHPHGAFAKLCQSIIGQQLSVKAAATIRGRLEERLGSWTADKVSAIDAAELRACGCSTAKVTALQSLAAGVLDGSHDLEGLRQLDDEAAITELSRMRGIGRWTAEMFLIFELRRPDVFSLGDAGLRRAIRVLYDAEADPGVTAAAWAPYRSTACRYLWASLDNAPA